MSFTDPSWQNTVTPVRAASRRRFLTGLVGSGVILLLGSPGIYSTVKSVQRQLTTKQLGLSSGDKLSWSSDLAYAAVAYPNEGHLKVWEYEHERIASTLNIDRGDSGWIAWSPDNQRLIYCSQQKTDAAHLACWNVQSQQQLYTTSGNFYISLGEPSWSPDGKKLAVFYDSTLFMLDAGNGQTLFMQDLDSKNSDQSNAIKALAWAPDSNRVGLLVEQSDRSDTSDARKYAVLIWDIVARRQSAQLVKQDQLPNNYQETPLAWSPSGDYLATILNKKLWLLHTSNSSKNVTFPQAFEEDYHLLAWSPDGQYLATTDSGQVGIWDSARKEQLRVLYRGHVAFRVEKLAWPSDGQQIALINDTNELVHLSW